MNSKIFKYIKYLSYVLLGLGVVVFIYFLVAMFTNTAPYPEYPRASEGAAQGTSVMLMYTYILFALTILVSIIFPLINIVKNPKGSMRSLIGILAMIVVLGVSFLFASDVPVVTPVRVYDNPVALKLSDMGLYAAYVMLIAVFAVILFGELKNAFKK